MTPFPTLSDADIDDIIAYCEGVIAGTYPPKQMLQQLLPARQVVVKTTSNNWIYLAIFGLLGVLALILGGIARNLKT